MTEPANRLLGPLLMVLATGSYVVNDTMMKIATEGLPPYQVLALRGVFATLWGGVLLAALGQWRNMHLAWSRHVVARNAMELVAILCFVVALANMPIADVNALGQITPMLVLIGASVFYGERLGPLAWLLIAVGFGGALLVAQPGLDGISFFAVLALANATFSAARDLVGRRVPAMVPGIVVAFGASALVLIGAVVAHVMLEQTVMPQPHHLMLLAGSGIFLFAGHFLIFTAYRVGSTGTVAPFFYFFTFWAIVSGLVVFGEFPNAMAVAGIVLVVTSGLAILLIERRRMRPKPTA
jgi:drug/metabolite transporter (DMT)-like permease